LRNDKRSPEIEDRLVGLLLFELAIGLVLAAVISMAFRIAYDRAALRVDGPCRRRKYGGGDGPGVAAARIRASLRSGRSGATCRLGRPGSSYLVERRTQHHSGAFSVPRERRLAVL
jgi:hypothetical protein